MLSSTPPIAFVPITDAARAKRFYGDTLGLKLLNEQLPYALVFDMNGVMLRATMVKDFKPHPFTVLGWNVTGINEVARGLRVAGVEFEIYPGMNQDQDGVWSTPGAKVAWFKDPEGNLLSISEH